MRFDAIVPPVIPSKSRTQSDNSMRNDDEDRPANGMIAPSDFGAASSADHTVVNLCCPQVQMKGDYSNEDGSLWPRVREIAEDLDQAKALAHQHHILTESS
jgi:hypothetical protein